MINWLFLSGRASGEKQKELKVYSAQKVEEEWTNVELREVLGSFNPAHSEVQYVPNKESLFFFMGPHNVHLNDLKKIG